MTQREKITLKRVDEKINTVMDSVEKIYRGMYGETENGNHGLIKRLHIVEVELQKMKTQRNKIVWVAIGAMAAIEAVQWFLK